MKYSQIVLNSTDDTQKAAGIATRKVCSVKIELYKGSI